MVEAVTEQAAKYRVEQGLIASGVITESTGMMAAAKKAATGKSTYEVHPEKITNALIANLDNDRVLGGDHGRDARNALHLDSLVTWSPDDVKVLAAKAVKDGLTQAPAVAAAPAVSSNVADSGSHVSASCRAEIVKTRDEIIAQASHEKMTTLSTNFVMSDANGKAFAKVRGDAGAGASHCTEAEIPSQAVFTAVANSAGKSAGRG